MATSRSAALSCSTSRMMSMIPGSKGCFCVMAWRHDFAQLPSPTRSSTTAMSSVAPSFKSFKADMMVW